MVPPGPQNGSLGGFPKWPKAYIFNNPPVGGDHGLLAEGSGGTAGVHGLPAGGSGSKAGERDQQKQAED